MSECCSICLEDTVAKKSHRGSVIIPRKSGLTILSCSHVYHRACIKKWYVSTCEEVPTCPCCRRPIRFHKLSSFYNKLLDQSKPTHISDTTFAFFQQCVSDLIDGFYIYYDNPTHLYISDIMTNNLHHCTWSVLKTKV
jgi:hypothetical protein